MTIEDEQPNNSIKIEDNFRSKNWKIFQTISTIVAELRNTEKAHESFDLIIKFNLELEDIVVILRNIFGLKDPVAHVVIDEGKNGGIFSSNILQQKASSQECYQKIASIVETCEKKFANLPIVIVTGSDSSVKIVILFPTSLQNPTLSESTLVYMIDPSSGNLDICKQTEKNLFFNYLQRGNAANGLNFFFKNLISNKKENVSKCKNSADSSYLCLIYCLFLFENGNDKLITAEWSNILKNFDLKKLALLNRIESYVAKRCMLLQNKPTKSLQLSQLNQIDSQIDQLLSENLSKLEKEKIKLEQNSELAQLDEMVRLEKTLVEKHQKLNIEIKSLEKLINEHLSSESVQPLGKSLTMEKKYKQFISGEERRRIETDEQKKLLSLRFDLMLNSEKESQKILHDQIHGITVLVRAKEQEVCRIKENISNLDNISKELSLQIAEQQKKLDASKTQLTNIANDKNFFLNEIKKSVRSAQSFNKLEIDSCPSKWIADVLKLNIYSDQDKLSDLGRRIDQLTKNWQQTNQKLEECKNQTNDLLVKRDENKVELDEFENEVSELKKTITAKKSELREKKTEKDSYDTFFWRILFFFTFNFLSKKVEEIKNCISKLENKLADLNSKIDSKKLENIYLNDKLEKLGRDKLFLSQILPNFSNKDIVAELKNIKNQIVEQFSEEHKKIQIKIDNAAISMIKIEKDISLYTSQIEIDVDQMTKFSKDKKELLEKIELINLKKKQLEDQMNKIKQTLDNKNDSNKNSEKKCIKIIREEVLGRKDYVNSAILSEKELFDLMNLTKFTGQKWNLLYRGSRDGFNSEDFHRKCDGFANTLTIIQSESNAVFGGYSGARWSKNGGFVEDQYSFIYSYYNTLNKKQIFECNRSLEAIYCEPNSGPSFGYNDVFIANECNQNYDSSCHVGYSYYNTINSYSSEESKEFFTGSASFKVNEIEVYTKNCEKLSQEKIEMLCEKSGKNSQEIDAIYDTYNTVAINGQISLELFVGFLNKKKTNIETENELKELQKILEFIFEYFDEDNSGYLDFFEFIECYFIFETKNRKKSQKAILEFLFDLGDKDYSQSLEIDEINELLIKFPNILNKNNFASHIKDRVNLNTNEVLARNEFSELLDLLFS